MTLGVIAVGILLYLTLPKWRRVYDLFPEKLTLNRFYDGAVERAQTGSFKFTISFMNGSIRSYLVYIFTFFIVILATSLFYKNALKVDTSELATIGIYEVLLALLIVIAAVSILFAKTRLSQIILLGAVGYTVSLFYVLFRAPDLALTQLVIETVSVALFLVCFYHLPKLRKEENRVRFKLTNAVVSVGVGIVVTLIALSAHSNKFFSSISQYYIENTYEKAAGKNMVNVILVDFRGFDTLFEIAVLAIAALGIFGMIKLRLARREEE
jgi:multicomponent Na+:H+ antiporter subunit A